MNLSEIAQHVEALKHALQEWPTLRPLIIKTLGVEEAATSTRPAAAVRMGASGEARPRRKMNAAQLKANSIRMKKRWAAVKKAGRTSL